MKVTTVSANIRFSKEIAGAWKVIELGADASIDSRESWQVAQSRLYDLLGQQLRAMWASNGKAQDGVEKPTGAASEAEPPQTSAQPPEHYCQEHQTVFKRYTHAGRQRVVEP